MEKLLKLYEDALAIYTEQVKGLEEQKKEVKKKHHIEWIPNMVLNSRMFTYNEFLLNPHYGGFCYKEKVSALPSLLAFIAEYERTNEQMRAAFEEAKSKGEYQEYFDELYLNRGSFIGFLERQLEELKVSESRLEMPRRPTRSNASRQLAEYREKMSNYEEERESIRRCRNEVNEMMETFSKL